MFIAKLANICTNQDVYMLLLFSLRKLNNNPPAKSPEIVIINTGTENHPVIIAIWYKEKLSALNTYANFPENTFFKAINAKPLKKNSSSKEFTKDI